MEMDEDYSSNIMETAPVDFDDTRSIASSVSHKKPLYKRAWRKVYKTITAPEKDASGQRISLRDSLSMRLSRDTSVSSSSGSFFTGLRTPRSARHPTSRSEFALSETHTAPLPLSSGGGSPTRGSVRTPYTVENAIPLPIPTEEEKKDKPDSARDLHPSLAPADGGAGRAQVPPLHTVDMSLSQLVGRTDDAVTPVTSARVGSVDSTPMKAPASAPQFSAASLLHADGTRSSLHPNSAREEPLQGSMSKRQPDRHVESKEEPYSKDGLHADLVLLDGNVGTGKSTGHKDLAENVNAVDFLGKGTEGASIDLKVDPADDCTADSDTCANPLATVLSAGAHSDVLENSVRELVSALEERLTTSGTLKGAISGKNVTGDSRNGAVGVSNVQGVGTSESTGSTSGLGDSASARDMIEKYEAEQPRARHIFSPSPKVKGIQDSAHGGNEDAMEGETNQPVQPKDGRKRGGPVRALAKVVMVAAVGAGAAFAIARAR